MKSPHEIPRRGPMTLEDIAKRVEPPAGAFIPQRYAALRTEAVLCLQRAVEAFCDGDDRKLGRAICDGQVIVRDIETLWHGSTQP